MALWLAPGWWVASKWVGHCSAPGSSLICKILVVNIFNRPPGALW